MRKPGSFCRPTRLASVPPGRHSPSSLPLSPIVPLSSSRITVSICSLLHPTPYLLLRKSLRKSLGLLDTHLMSPCYDGNLLNRRDSLLKDSPRSPRQIATSSCGRYPTFWVAKENSSLPHRLIPTQDIYPFPNHPSTLDYLYSLHLAVSLFSHPLPISRAQRRLRRQKKKLLLFRRDHQQQSRSDGEVLEVRMWSALRSSRRAEYGWPG